MLTPKEILQIDATVIAGILVLLTLVSIESDALDIQLQKWNIDIEKLSRDQRQLIESLEKDSTITQEEITEVERLRNELNRLQQDLNTLTPQIEEEQIKKDVNFLLQPQDWIFYGGIGFAVSAFFAIIASVCEPQISKKKVYGYLLGISLIFMSIGFGYLVIIFFKIGGSL